MTPNLPVAVSSPVVLGGIDTHKDLHVAAVIDAGEKVLGTHSFSTTRAGYRALIRWLRSFGDVRRVGVEGTGSYGAGIARYLLDAGIEVVEVRARRNALQLLRMTIVAAPEELRDQVRNLTRMQLIRTCAAWRPDTTNVTDPVSATRIALKSLARRILELGDEIAMLDELIKPIVTALAPQLLARPGIGVEIAGQLLVTAGDNTQRLRGEAGFAMLCGVAPLPASSGMTQRHRLNRGGDRQANSALHLAVISRLRIDE